MSEHFRKYIKKEHYPVQPANIRFKTSFKNCIFEALERRTWKESENESEWDIYWTEKEWIHEVMDHVHLAPHQRLNHFRNYFELCRKDNLIKNLKRHKKALEKEGKFDEAAEYNFFPTTYNLPGEYSIFCEEFKKNSNNVWIMKPIGKAQGKGIFLFNKLSQVSQWKNDNRWKQDSPQVESYIAQRYINNPLLIGGKKFDMRIYCLVTSYSPLVAYLYRDGFARFTHHRYDSEDITNSYVHLTNVAIQKTSENYDEKLGGKWDLAKLKLYLMSQYGRDAVSQSFADIQRVIIRSLQCVQKVMMNDKHCFELYGFDILLDAQLKPWLIEVNGSPSMTANTPQDFELKCGLLDDVFTIIDMEKILTGQEEQIGGFDLICKGVPIKNESTLFTTMLGCHNNRSQQLKKLSKLIASKLSQVSAQQEKEEAKKATKDTSSISTADTVSTGPKIRTRIIAKVEPVTTTAKMSRIPPTFAKQNTMIPTSSQSQPQPTVINKDPKEVRDGNQSVSVSASRSLPGRPRETGRGKATVGLPPVNGQISTPVSNISNATPIGNTSSNVPQRTPSYPGTLQQGFTAHVNALSSSPVGVRQQFSQPLQSQAVSAKSPSALQLAGSASLKSDMSPSYESYKRVKGKSMASMQDGLEQKQNVYDYDISDLASSKFEDKSEKYTFVRNSEVMASRSEQKKSSIFGGKSENSNSNEEGSSYGRKKLESQESNEKYASSHEQEDE